VATPTYWRQVLASNPDFESEIPAEWIGFVLDRFFEASPLTDAAPTGEPERRIHRRFK
jgi:hypothetical protein